MIIDKNSDSSVDLVDWLRRSSDESEGLLRANGLDSAKVKDVYLGQTLDRFIVDVEYLESANALIFTYNTDERLVVELGEGSGGSGDGSCSCDIDLSEYAKLTDLESEVSELESKIPTSTSSLTNDSDFVNQTQVDERIKEVIGAAPEALDTLQEISKALGNDPDFAATITNQITEVKSLIPSVDGLATEKYVDEAIKAIPEVDLTGYAKEEWVESQGYLTEHQDISHLATKDEIPSVEGFATEAYVGQAKDDIQKWVEDQAYLTEHQDISHLATKDELKSAIESIVIPEAPEVDLSGLATKEELTAVEAKIPSIEGLATQSWVEEKIAEAELDEVDIDVSLLATKSELAALEAKIPSTEGLATEQYVDDKFASIEHPTVDLTGYATEDYVNEKIESIEVPTVDLTGYAKEEWVEEKINSIEIPSTEGLATETYVNEAIANIEHPTTNLTGYATEEWVEAKGYLTEHQDISGLASMQYVEDKALEIEAKIPNLDPYATRAWVEETIAGMETGDVDHSIYALKSDLDGLATESYVNAKIADIEHPTVDLSGLATKEELTAVEGKIPSIEGLATETYVQEQIEAIEHPTVDLTGYATETYVDDKVANIEIPEVDLTGYATEEWVESKGYLTEHQDISDVVRYNTTSDGRKAITLANHDLIMGRTTSGDTSPLVMLSKWDVADFGSKEVHANINTLSTTDIATDSEGKNIYTDGLTIYDNDLNQVENVPVVTVNDTFSLATLNHMMAIREADAATNASTYQPKGDYAEKTWVEQKIAEAQLDDPDVDVSVLATKSELALVEAKIPSIEGLATETYVDDKVASIEVPEVDLSSYATKDELNSKIAALNSNFQWKDNVVTYDDIATLYPDPEEGFSVYVDDEQTTYVYMGGEWVAVASSGDDEIPQATEELDGLMPAEAMRKLNSLENYDDSAIQGDITSLEAMMAILEAKVSALSKTNVEVVAATDSVMTLADSTKDYTVQGDVTANLSVTDSKSVTISDATVSNDARLSLSSNGDVELKGITTEGDFAKSSGNAIVNISEAASVVIKDMTINSTQYNGIEVGLSGSVLPKSIIIDNCDFNGEFSNNAISIHGTQDDAIVNISNCKFESVSNVLRLSNRTNAKGVTINLTNCSCNKWDADTFWSGILIMQDFTSTTVEEADINNLFGKDKITVNFINFTLPSGEKLTMPEDLSTICATNDENQILYAVRNADYKANDNTFVHLAYGDGTVYPTINII